MSYIRAGHPLKYVEGESNDYVWSDGEEITDYGNISDTGFIELLHRYWNTDDTKFKEHLLKRLAKRLDVKVRKKPLTDKQLFKEYDRIGKEANKRWKDIYEEHKK